MDRSVGHFARHFSTEAAADQKANLACPLARVTAGLAKPSCPDTAGAIELAGFQDSQGVVDSLPAQSPACQFLLYAGQPEAFGAAVDHRIENALLVDEVFGLQFIEQPLELAGFARVCSELALEFEP